MQLWLFSLKLLFILAAASQNISVPHNTEAPQLGEPWRECRNIRNWRNLRTRVCVCAQLCSTVCDPRDCSLPGSSVLGILQARIMEWVAIPFSRGILLTQGLNLSPESPALVGRFFTIVLPRKPNLSTRNLKLIYPFITVAKVRCVYVLPVCIYQILKKIGVKGED